MVTHWSHTLIPTAREVPAEAEVPSHQLMLRAGFLRKLGSGMYTYLPLGLRSLQKAMAIVRQEMARAGAYEVLMPALIPIELYQQTKRDEAYGDNLFRLTDRHGRKQALGPTHEEVITELMGAYVESYRDLPKTLYQIQTKFRDEFRPRFGVLRSREFQMKDAYSFHMAVDGPGGLNEIYDKQYAAYCRIFTRCGLPYEIVEAESGPIGGSASHEFMVPSPTGEDTILKSDKGNYAANVEKCEIGTRKVSRTFDWRKPSVFGRYEYADGVTNPPKGELTSIPTPGVVSIDQVCDFFKRELKSKLSPANTLKTVIFTAEPEGMNEKFWVIAVVRGDRDVNEGKLQRHCNREAGRKIELTFADAAKLSKFGVHAGSMGPTAAVRLRAVQVVVDHDAAQDQFWVAGGLDVDTHVKNFHWERDVLSPLGDDRWRVKVDEIGNAVAGDPSPKNDGGILQDTKGIEIGHVFKLGDKYTKAMDITVLGPNNERLHPIMGCYGIGVNRILASAIERAPSTDRGPGYDENGIVWPAAIAPYSVVITPIKYDGEVAQVVNELAAALEQQTVKLRGDAADDAPVQVDVLIDDRDERPGVKFKDADLIGIPVRITVGDKGLKEGKVEIKARNGTNGDKGELVPVSDAVAHVVKLLATL
jgi:prolyl-tRNA synthetase